MSKVIITGVTGNAGSAVLTAALASPSISHVTVLSRRPPFVTHDKLTTIIIPSEECPKGFDELTPPVLERIKDHTSVIWALGISQTQVSKDEYVKITHDYTMAAAQAFSAFGTPAKPFRFIYMSGEGADQSEKGRAIFSKIKGRTEKELHAIESPSFQTLSVRPGGILPTSEHAPRMGALMRYGLGGLGAVMKVVYPSVVIDSSELGKVCVGLAIGDGKGWEKRTGEGWIANPQLREFSTQWK